MVSSAATARAPTSGALADGAERIVMCARPLFASRGFAGTSIADVARAAGVCKSTVFHHFASKQALYLEVLRAACSDFAREMREAIEGAGDFEERLHRFTRAQLASMFARSAETRLILREFLDATPDSGQTLANTIHESSASLLHALLDEAKAAGLLHAHVDPAAVTLLLTGANSFYFMSSNVLRHVDRARGVGLPEDFADGLARLVLGSILAHERPASDSPDTGSQP